MKAQNTRARIMAAYMGILLSFRDIINKDFDLF